MLAPIMTKWYQLLHRLQFSTPTKALIYRVRYSSLSRVKGLKTCVDLWLVRVPEGVFGSSLFQSASRRVIFWEYEHVGRERSWRGSQ